LRRQAKRAHLIESGVALRLPPLTGGRDNVFPR
jgi:hypothetical protein